MKTVLILPFAYTIQLCFLCGQATYPLKTLEDSLPFRVEARGRHLELRWQSGEQPWANARAFASIQSIRLQDGDLILDFIPPKNKPALSYTFDWWMLSATGRLLRPKALRYAPGQSPGQASQSLVWEDITELLREPGAVYTLFIRRSLMGAVNCLDQRPEFTLARQLPMWVAGGLGAVMIGAGQLYNGQKKELYANYRAVWRDEGTEPAAQVFFNAARQKEKTARALTYAGWATLGASAVWYGWQRIRIQKKQKVFDTFCRPEAPVLSFRPALLETPVVASFGGLRPALALQLSF